MPLGSTPGGSVKALVVLTGPIGSGKSTVSLELAKRYFKAGLSFAICDLDDVVVAQGGPRVEAELWRRAGVAHVGLVRGWFDAGADVVIAHGPFYESGSYEALFAAAPSGAFVRHVRLNVTYEVALQRVTNDPDRRPNAQSKRPDFLHATHKAFDELAGTLPPANDVIDTTPMTASEVAERIASSDPFRIASPPD